LKNESPGINDGRYGVRVQQRCLQDWNRFGFPYQRLPASDRRGRFKNDLIGGAFNSGRIERQEGLVPGTELRCRDLQTPKPIDLTPTGLLMEGEISTFLAWLIEEVFLVVRDAQP
jgi:hypothetical protein